MREQYDVLIVGGGHGGANTAVTLRQRAVGGTVAIIDAELTLPYQRPPLSKAYLAGALGADRFLIRPESYWSEHEIDILGGRRVVAIATEDRSVITDQGETIGYRNLVWATGSTPRRLNIPGHDLPGVHVLRTLVDATALRRDAESAADIVLIGGGYIGLETAATLTKLGARVTVVESLDRVLSRVADEVVSRFYEAEHRAHGVEVRLGGQVAGFESSGGRLSAVHLSNGEVLPCQVAVVGIGGEAEVGPLAAAGANLECGGVLVDARCRTGLPDVFAIGDCAAAPNPYAGGRVVRLESVQNAVDQGMSVARLLAGQSDPGPTVPYFWSDQYDVRLRTTGLSGHHDATVLRGDPHGHNFSVISVTVGRDVAIDSVNAPKDFAQGRALVQASAYVDPLAIADPAIPLAELASSSR